MAITLTELITNVRSAVDEATARGWSDAELTVWINDGLKDVARKTQSLQQYSASIAGVASQAKYDLPTDLLGLHRVEYQTGTQVYPLQLMTIDEFDQYWGLQQDTASSYPFIAYTWGFPGAATSLKLGIYPVLSSSTGTIRIWYYRLPVTLASGTDVAEIPAGWENLVVDYCEYRARRKFRDPSWQEAKALYDENLSYMIDSTRQWQESNQSIQYGNLTVPAWIYGGDDY